MRQDPVGQVDEDFYLFRPSCGMLEGESVAILSPVRKFQVDGITYDPQRPGISNQRTGGFFTLKQEYYFDPDEVI